MSDLQHNSLEVYLMSLYLCSCTVTTQCCDEECMFQALSTIALIAEVYLCKADARGVHGTCCMCLPLHEGQVMLMGTRMK
jgi:hypothetical protein